MVFDLTMGNSSVTVVLRPREAGFVADLTTVQKPSSPPVCVDLMLLQLIPRRKHFATFLTASRALSMQFLMLFYVEHCLTTDVAHGELPFSALDLPLSHKKSSRVWDVKA